ncbi:MAG: hypothetical protein MI757_00740, partial [Pirellulales bacterium]|nr:hypothetical protein [Pirellulales bacterium]
MLTLRGSIVAAVLSTASLVHAFEMRPETHEQYGRSLWKYVVESQPWEYWTPGLVGLQPAYGPRMTDGSRAYVNAQGWT